MNKLYAINFAGALVMVYVLARFISYSQAVTMSDGIMIGFWVWFGFVATIMLGSITWEGKPPRLYYLNAGYQLVNLLIAGAILAVWS
jgi:hypothetical protein